MASVRGILNIQSLNELTYENTVSIKDGSAPLGQHKFELLRTILYRAGTQQHGPGSGQSRIRTFSQSSKMGLEEGWQTFPSDSSDSSDSSKHGGPRADR
jgi:hypothetical protein